MWHAIAVAAKLKPKFCAYLINCYHCVSFCLAILYSNALGTELGHLKAVSDANTYRLPDEDGLLTNRQKAEFIFRDGAKNVVASNLLQVLVSIDCFNTRNGCRRRYINAHQLNITLRRENKLCMKSRRRQRYIVDIERFSRAMERS